MRVNAADRRDRAVPVKRRVRAVGWLYRRLHGEERGAIAVLVGLLIVVLVSIAALVVDATDAETEVRANQSRADFAALAGGAWLPDYPFEACSAAWSFLKSNTPAIPGGATSPCQNGFHTDWPLGKKCQNGTATAKEYPASGLPAELQIKFTFPVTDGNAALLGRAGSFDGSPCERFGVSISGKRPSVFGGIVGSSGLTSRGHAVARGFIAREDPMGISLVTFDPVGCEPILAQGQGGIKVFPVGDTPGFISSDSDGKDVSCSSATSWTIDAEGGNTLIMACGPGSTVSPEVCTDDGVIALHAMDPGQIDCVLTDVEACDPTDVIDGRVFPQPLRLARRLTRAPVDYAYNCKDSYPAYMGLAIAACSGATSESDFIDELRAFVDSGDDDDGGAPSGFSTYGGVCDIPASGLPIVVPPGNWYVDCPVFTIRKDVTFLGGNIVFEGGINLTSQGSLTINACPVVGTCPATLSPSCLTTLCPTAYSETHAWVYLKAEGGATNQGFTKSAQAPLTMNNAMMYIHQAGNKGYINLSGGDADFTWSSPTEGPFEDLVLWSESATIHALAGQAAQNIVGGMFMPYANPFRYTGQGAQVQTHAQFLTYRILADGQGSLVMQPDPDRQILMAIPAVVLIR